MEGAGRVRRYRVGREGELRVEVGRGDPSRSRVRAMVVDGSAEIFGTPVLPLRWIPLNPGLKLSIFTWDGATIELDGVPDVVYVAEENETPMASYANMHAMLEQRRCRARDAVAYDSPEALYQSQGPRVIVAGPSDSGKSSLTKMLLGWAARQGWNPTYVDLDIGQGSLTIPGTIAATPIDMPVDPIEGVPLDAPLVYFYGHTTPSVNADLYRTLVKELAHTLDMQLARNAETRAAGMVINTMGWVESLGYELLLHAIQSLNADVILVLGQENLYSMLQDKFKSKPSIEVVKLDKSGGVVARNSKCRQWTRYAKIREYFQGWSGELAPHETSTSFGELQVFRVGGPRLPPLLVTPVAITPHLLHAVLAVSYAKDQHHLLCSNVAGFIRITGIDMQRRKVMYVSPCPGPLPNNVLILGSVTWVE